MTRPEGVATLQLLSRSFLPPDDPRIVATVERIDAELTRNGGRLSPM